MMRRDFQHRFLFMTCCAWIAFAAAIDSGVPCRAEGTGSLQFRLSEPEPFIGLPETADREVQLTRRTPLNGATPDSSFSPAAEDTPTRTDIVESIKLKPLATTEQELAQLGQNDALVGDLLRVVKWSVVMFLVGLGVAIAIRKSGWKGMVSPASSHLKVVETLPLGRQMGVHLVQAGGDRFLVATDATGIKSLTLIPNWPHLDDAEHPTESEDQVASIHPLIKAA